VHAMTCEANTAPVARIVTKRKQGFFFLGQN
jgi:hypothetical protein